MFNVHECFHTEIQSQKLFSREMLALIQSQKAGEKIKFLAEIYKFHL